MARKSSPVSKKRADKRARNRKIQKLSKDLRKELISAAHDLRGQLKTGGLPRMQREILELKVQTLEDFLDSRTFKKCASCGGFDQI